MSGENNGKRSRRNGGSADFARAAVANLDQRALPSNVEAERMVLGSILLDGATVFPSIVAILRPDDFALQKHRTIFKRMCELAERGEAIDRVTVANALISNGELEACDGLTYLISLDEGLPRIPNVESYARIVNDKSALRKVIFASQKAMNTAMAQTSTPEEVLQGANEVLLNLATDRDSLGGRCKSLGAIIDGFPGGIEGICGGGPRRAGLATGFSQLDNLTGGFQPGDLIVLGGRPSMGKTALALSISLYVASRPGVENGVVIHSLEMSEESVLTRLLCQQARVNSYAFRGGMMNREDRRRIADGLSVIHELPIHVDDRASVTVPDIYVNTRRLMTKGKIVLLVVDYLGLVASTERHENRVVEVGYITKGLKRMAKELGIPVLLLAQLSRSCEARTDKRPILADLRESGEIEQDADLVGFVYRDEVYKPDRDDLRGVAELLIRKQRNGPIGTVKMVYVPGWTKFENPTDEVPPDA